MITIFVLACFITVNGPEHSYDVWPLWRTYAAHFVRAGGREIDRTKGDRMLSEGQAYAHFFALLINNRKRFIQSCYHFMVDSALYPSWEFQCIIQ